MGSASSISLDPALSSVAKSKNLYDSDYYLKKLSSEDYSTVVGDCDQWEDHSLGKDTVDDNETISNKSCGKSYTFFASLEDLKVKSTYVLSNTTISRVFVRYLFYGMWITDILQIPNDLYVSPTAVKAPSSFIHDHRLEKNSNNPTMNSLIHELEKATIFEDVNVKAWEKFFQESRHRVDGLIMDPVSVSFAASSISFIELLFPDDKYKVSILTIALAMQAFCRSDLFMHLSEHKWSSDSIRTSQWQDYARVGRGLVANYYEQHNNHACKHQQPVCGLNTVALLDALYVRLLLTSSQTSIFKFLYTAHWMLELDTCLKSLPLDIAVYETSNTSTTNTIWSIVSEHCFHVDQGKMSFLPDDQSCSSAATLQSFFDHLRTSPSPTFFVTSHCKPSDQTQCNAIKNQDDFQFSAVTPVFRSPLLTFSSTSPPSSYKIESKCIDSLAMDQAKDYRWDLHRIVVAKIAISTAGYSLLDDVHMNNPDEPDPIKEKLRKKLACRSEANVRNMQATIDMSFIIAQIVG